jgi:tellurite resistance protein
MMQPAPTVDPYSQALGRLVGVLAEDAIFALAAVKTNAEGALEELGKRRADAHSAVLQGVRTMRMIEDFDHWIIEMARAIAPVAPPVWMPMSEVIREKVTLEGGASGLRSLFSSKPSDKDVQRVKRLGTFSVRVLRAVFSADGMVDPEEARTISAMVGSLGLSDADASPLYTEAPMPVDRLDIYGEIEPKVARAVIRGAWLAAAWDAIDPREEAVIRALAQKLNFPDEELERERQEAIRAVDQRRQAGLAAVDGVRYMLSDRMPGLGVQIAAKAGTVMLPRRYREEALMQVGHGAPVTLAGRYVATTSDERTTILGIAWAAALYENPTMGRRALLRARHDRFAQDLGDSGQRIREALDGWVTSVLTPVAFTMSGAASTPTFGK